MTTRPRLQAAVIGDVIQSRQHPDRNVLQRSLRASLAEVESVLPAIQPFTMTIGDEFQGLFRSLDEAVTATLVLQILTTGTVRLRFGIGLGEVLVLAGAGPYEQDGSAWWRAREAIDRVRAGERAQGAPDRWVTGLVAPDHPAGELYQGYLQLRDHVVGGIDGVDADIVMGLMRGRTQVAMAAQLGLDKGAVSRRVGRHGLSALLASLPAEIRRG